MDISKNKIRLKIKRFDLSDDPEIIEKEFEFSPSMDIDLIRTELFELCEASPKSHVLKIRNGEKFLIPLSLLLENDEPFYYIEVALIACFGNSGNSLVKEAHVDSLCNKLKSLETRISRAESELPDFDLRREAYTEETVAAMLTKVKFLNRRFDELFPEHKEELLSSGAGPSSSKD